MAAIEVTALDTTVKVGKVRHRVPQVGQTYKFPRAITDDLILEESSDHSATPLAGFGQLWVRSDSPNVLVFTDDAGTDFDISAPGGAFTADVDTQITPTTPIVLDHATNNEIALDLQYTTNKAAGNDTGLLVNMTDTASPGTSLLVNLMAGGGSQFSVNSAGTADVVTLRWAASNNNRIFESSNALRIGALNGLVIQNDITNTSTSGTPTAVKIAPFYNQASGTAANTDLLINRTETAVGSGAQLLQDWQAGSVSQAKVDNIGAFNANSLECAKAFTVATLPTAVVGKMARITDGDGGLAWGATAINSGAGATPYLVWYNGSVWSVMGK